MFYKLEGSAIKFYYGKCLQTPYKENNLWFVYVPGWFSIVGGKNQEGQTFLVDQKYAQQFYMDEWLYDFKKWRKIAHKIIQGDWCSHYERIWNDVPVFEHRLSSGDFVKYGYCRTQPRNSPDRELWFVAFQHGYTFVVDHVCATPDFIERMGTDELKWQIICWGKLDHEVEWEKLKTGNTEGGYVRSAPSFALDSPYLPFTLDDVEKRITNYEQEVREVIKFHKLDGKRKFLSQQTRPTWDTMDMRHKSALLGARERRTGKKIINF